MGEANDDVADTGTDKVDADGNLTKSFKGDVHAAKFAVRLLKAIGKKAIVVPDEQAVRNRITGAARLLSEYRYTEDASRFDDDLFNLTDEEVASYDGPPKRLALMKQLRHPIASAKTRKTDKAAAAELKKTITNLQAFVNAEKIRIADELEGKRVIPSATGDGTTSQDGPPPKGTQRLSLVYQARAAKLAAELMDQEKYAEAQRVIQALMYIDTMGKLARKDTRPEEAPTADGFVQGATLRDAETDATDASRKEADDYLDQALSKRGKPNSKPVKSKAEALFKVAKNQVAESDQLFTVANLLEQKSRAKLVAILDPIRPRFYELDHALKLSLNLKLKVDVADKDIDLDDVPESEVTESLQKIERHEARLKTVEERIQETEEALDAARDFYAENSEIDANLRNVLFSDLLKGKKKKGKVRMEGAALTGVGDIKAQKSALPQGPLKDIVAKYNTIRALEKTAAADPESRALVTKLQKEVNHDVSFLEKNMETYKAIEKLIEEYEKELARKRWAYDAANKLVLEDNLDKYKERLNKARTAEDLQDKVKARIENRLRIIRDDSVPRAGRYRTKAEALRDRLDKFEKEHLKPLGKALHEYSETYDIAYKSAKDTVKGYVDDQERKSDRKTLKSAAKKAGKKVEYKGKFDIEFQNIRGSLRIEKPESVTTQTKLLDSLQERIKTKKDELDDQIELAKTARGYGHDPLKASSYDPDVARDARIDITFSEREAGRIATIKPLMEDTIKRVDKLLSSNKFFAPKADKATFDSLETRLKSVKARMKQAKSSEEFNALWDEMRGIDEERLAAIGAGKIDDEEKIDKIVDYVVEAEDQLGKALGAFFKNDVAQEAKYASSRLDEDVLAKDKSIQTFVKYCDPSSPDNKKAVIDKFAKRLPEVLGARKLGDLYKTNWAAAFEEGASDTARRAAKEELLSDLRWRREMVITSAHGKKMRLNPFDNGDHVNAYLRVLQAAEGQIMAKVK